MRVDESNVVTEHHPDSVAPSNDNTASNRPEDDELVKKMNGLDATLVKMMRKIEMQAQSTRERYQLMNFAYGGDKNYVKKRDYLNRYYEGVRKTRRADEGKRREEKLAAEKRAR